jgi:hypothetical protein
MAARNATALAAPAGQRDELDRQEPTGVHPFLCVLLDQHQALGHEGWPNRNDHAAARLELLDQWRRNVTCCRGYDDGISAP